MVKKLLSVLLIACMAIAIVACGKKDDSGISTTPTTVPADQGDTGEEVTPTEEVTEREPAGELTIGNTTELSGDWIPYFQNGAADYDVYLLTNGYGTVDMTAGGEYVVNNTTVKEYTTTDNADGSVTYTWTINDGLVYNDGSAITAADYVASILLWSSKAVGDMGADNDLGYYFVGWEAYSKGEAKEFAGVRLIDEKTFSLTIDPKYLPYYYQLPMVAASPTKLSFWTDETIVVKDDGNGAYLPETFTKEAYEAKINAARAAVPRITAGPYNLKSYDEASKTAVLEINTNYLGNYEGQKANIKTLIYKMVTSETALDELATGQVDLLNGMASGDEINAGLDLVDSGNFAYTAYDRAGYGKLQFVGDFGPTQFIEVRHAIAHLLDRNDFAKAFTGGFGSVVNGPYGVAMWMYQESIDELDEKLNQYPYSLDTAKQLLVDGGWVLDENGNEYTSGIRYKKLEDGTLMPLVIEWASSENNAVSELLVVKLQENPDLAAAGIQINQTVMTFSELLNYLYRDGSEDAKYGVPTYHMYNLATNYTPRYDLSNTYTTDPDMLAQGYNNNFLIDEELDKLAKDMVLVDPEDKELYRQKFVAFVERWNHLLPDLPLYSNIYHDFYAAKLKNYNPNAIWDLTEALIYAYIEE